MQCDLQQICITVLKSSVDDLTALCKAAASVPDPQTGFMGDIQVHAAVHAGLFFAFHTWKWLVVLAQLEYLNNNHKPNL